MPALPRKTTSQEARRPAATGSVRVLRRLAGLLAPTLLFHVAAAQVALDPGLHPTQFVHTAWQVEDGLPQNSVYAVVQTKDGYIWLGTQEGLVRFDGHRFTVLDRGHVDGLESNEIRALLEDRDGDLWIGTNGGGISRLHRGILTSYTTKDGMSSDLVRSLHQDREGAIWIGTIDGGLNRFDGTTFVHVTPEDGLAGSVVLALAEDAEGDLWAGTEAGLSRLRNGRVVSHSIDHPLAERVVWALHRDEAGALWAGLTGGLLRLEGGNVTAYSEADGLCGTTASALHSDAASTLWIGTLEGGLCRLRDGRFDGFSTAQGLTHDRVRALARDREGNLWIGTEGGGLNQLRQGKFTPITTAEGLSADVVFTVLEDRRGAVWIGTEGGGLNRLVDGRVTHFGAAQGLPATDVYALHEDGKGRLWVGLFGGGLCRLENERFACFSEDDGLSSDNVYAIMDDRHGALWVGTEAGLDRLENGTITPFGGEDLEHVPITALHEDREGHVWIGTYGTGLRRVSDGATAAWTSENGLSSDIVLALHEDGDGSLWVGTQGGGLCRIRDERIACATSREGLHNDNVLQILDDGLGSLWIGSNRGIFRIETADFEAYADGLSESISYTLFGTADGLETSEASGGTQPAAWRARDGRLWFSTIRGAASIDPQRVFRNSVEPPVVVERILAAGQSVPFEGGFSLGAGHRDLSFHYTALSFAAPDQVRFHYMLEGYDEAWIDAGDRREAYYTGLAPGSYRFRVRAANADGLWNEDGSSVAFYLAPHFYQTTWFLGLCLIALILLALTAHRLRVRRLEARERELERVVEERTHDLRLEKEKTEESKAVIEAQAEKLRELDRFKTRFFANVSHEFRTPLTLIVGPLENALSGGYGAMPDRMRQQVEIMMRNAHRLLRLINQLLDLSKIEAGKMQLQAGARDVVAFLEGIVLSCTAFAERKGIDLDFHSDAKVAELYYEPDKLEKVFFNLLSNATKFTPTGGRISVTLTLQPPGDGMPDGGVEIRVRDTGKGIAPEQLPYIFDRFHQVDGSNTREHEGTGIGLSLVKELVTLHRGTISVESELGVGTTFVLVLPAGCAHLSPDETNGAGDSRDALTELASSAFDFMHDDDAVLPATGSLSAPADAPLLLVVDDRKDVRDYIAAILDDTYRVETAFDGEDGLSRAQTLSPDLIISDVMMPRMDGNEFCRRVKASAELNHIPVILLTARATLETRLEGLDGGADDYLAKPFNAQELRARVRNLLQIRRQEREVKALNENLERRVSEQVDVILEQRTRYEADLIAARDRAETSERLKTAILNNMSHELRTPLTAILGYSEIIAMEAPEALQEFAGAVNANGQRLMRTLNAVMDLSRLEAAVEELRGERFDLAELTRDTAADYHVRAGRKGIAVHFHAPDGGGVPIDGDRKIVEQILQHLFDNAVKFTEAGHVRITVGEVERGAFVRVADTGIGIGPEFLPRVFDAFSQQSDGLSRDYEGTGLSLTVAQRLAGLIGGEIDVESTPGEGSVFTLTVALHRGDSAAPAQHSSPAIMVAPQRV